MRLVRHGAGGGGCGGHSSGSADAPGFHDRVSTLRTGRKGRESLPFTLSPSIVPRSRKQDTSRLRDACYTDGADKPRAPGGTDVGHRQ